MKQEEIAAMFRKGELERREARRKQMLNHAQLNDSAPEDAAVIKQLQAQSREFERAATGSYFQRLWWALINKR